MHVVVPEAVERGSKVEMRCLYDLEQEDLYSVKWYRGDREFYRYSPRDVPPLRIFGIPGIEVDVSSSSCLSLYGKQLRCSELAQALNHCCLHKLMGVLLVRDHFVVNLNTERGLNVDVHNYKFAPNYAVSGH